MITLKFSWQKFLKSAIMKEGEEVVQYYEKDELKNKRYSFYEFVLRSRVSKKTGAKTEEGLLAATRETLSFCKDNDILKEYIMKKEKEVEDLCKKLFVNT